MVRQRTAQAVEHQRVRDPFRFKPADQPLARKLGPRNQHRHHGRRQDRRAALREDEPA